MLSWLESLYVDWRRRIPIATRSPPVTGSRGRLSEPDGPDATSRPPSPDASDAVGRDSDHPTTVAEPDGSSSWERVLGGEEVSKKEVQLELGIRPQEFIVWLVRDAGGRMWQADVVKTTGWSKSTVSRYLDGLESDDAVERIWIGRRKLVGVPGELLDSGPTVDLLPVESPADSWSAEADEPA